MSASPQTGAWRRGHSTNLVGIPTDLLASAAFNDAAPVLHIAGAREAHHHLFTMLDAASDSARAAQLFEDYMAVVFGLHPEQRMAPRKPGERRRYRSSYLRLLRGWAFDSNGAEAAVLKGWVESRFGLLPTFHCAPIDRFAAPAWARYVEEKMGSRFHNNAIYGQLDLLYEFAQWRLGRDGPADRRLLLYRGVNDFDEHPLIERIDRRTVVIRLNNVTSFTEDRDIATCFGAYILETWVPTAKILFYNALLPQHAVKGEGEVIAIGGDFRVQATYY
ncbi:MAG: NAD(+)--dinitrogen-reductase ADP-D-ribosyltransferase [Rhodospirillales bacterium]|nr:MAG: NAD(+)--dinitrogen-reductase ADP-D-ribosyltransferase [Rhodospirillales bacterium]